MIFINFKSYGNGDSSQIVWLVKTVGECKQETGVQIIPVVRIENAKESIGSSNIEIWVQHTDSPETAHTTGIKGTFLNHSDNKIGSPNTLSDLIDKCKDIGLKNMVFSASLEELKKVIGLKPDFVAYEPPELIASPTASVVRAKPEIISEAVEIAKTAGIPLIVGAGVKDAADVKKSLELGAVGVAVSSAVVLAQDPKQVVLDLARGFTK